MPAATRSNNDDFSLQLESASCDVRCAMCYVRCAGVGRRAVGRRAVVLSVRFGHVYNSLACVHRPVECICNVWDVYTSVYRPVYLQCVVLTWVPPTQAPPRYDR
eukprot:1444409-Rhodomonas_salina.2